MISSPENHAPSPQKMARPEGNLAPGTVLRDGDFRKHYFVATKAFVLVIGNVERFRCGKQITSYLVWFQRKTPVGNDGDWGHISKQRSDFVPVPEPSTLALVGMGMRSIFGKNRLRQHQRRMQKRKP